MNHSGRALVICPLQLPWREQVSFSQRFARIVVFGIDVCKDAGKVVLLPHRRLIAGALLASRGLSNLCSQPVKIKC